MNKKLNKHNKLTKRGYLTGGEVGTTAGAVLGTAVGGPLGSLVGSTLGGAVGNIAEDIFTPRKPPIHPNLESNYVSNVNPYGNYENGGFSNGMLKLMSNSKNPNIRKRAKKMANGGYSKLAGYEDGGSLTPLNSTDNQVNATNPNLTDSVGVGDGNYLDNNETTTGNFIFSDNKKDLPIMKNGKIVSPASYVKPYQKLQGLMEERTKMNPQDTISQNTIKATDNIKAGIGAVQENMAVKKGMRKLKNGGRLYSDAQGPYRRVYKLGGYVNGTPDINPPLDYMSGTLTPGYNTFGNNTGNNLTTSQAPNPNYYTQAPNENKINPDFPTIGRLDTSGQSYLDNKTPVTSSRPNDNFVNQNFIASAIPLVSQLAGSYKTNTNYQQSNKNNNTVNSLLRNTPTNIDIQPNLNEINRQKRVADFNVGMKTPGEASSIAANNLAITQNSTNQAYANKNLEETNLKTQSNVRQAEVLSRQGTEQEAYNLTKNVADIQDSDNSRVIRNSALSSLGRNTQGALNTNIELNTLDDLFKYYKINKSQIFYGDPLVENDDALRDAYSRFGTSILIPMSSTAKAKAKQKLGIQ